MTPAAAAASCRDLLKRHKLNSVLTTGFWSSCVRQEESTRVTTRAKNEHSTYRRQSARHGSSEDPSEHLDDAGALQGIEGRCHHRDILDRFEHADERF
jgi:hypothetical protein